MTSSFDGFKCIYSLLLILNVHGIVIGLCIVAMSVSISFSHLILLQKVPSDLNCGVREWLHFSHSRMACMTRTTEQY